MSDIIDRKLHFTNNYYINEKNNIVVAQPEINEITFLPDEYDDVDVMWKEIANLQRTLLRNNQIVRVRQEEDLVIVEHVHNRDIDDYGGTCLEFITDEERELIDSMRHEDCSTIKELLKLEENKE